MAIFKRWALGVVACAMVAAAPNLVKADDATPKPEEEAKPVESSETKASPQMEGYDSYGNGYGSGYGYGGDYYYGGYPSYDYGYGGGYRGDYGYGYGGGKKPCSRGHGKHQGERDYDNKKHGGHKKYDYGYDYGY